LGAKFSLKRRVLYHKNGCQVNGKRKKFAHARYGKGKVFSARHSRNLFASLNPLGLARSNREPRLRGGYAQGLGARSWHMKRQKLSRRPTTRWDELMTAK